MNTKTWRHAVIAFAALGMAFHAASAMAKPRTLSGTVTYRERMALPPSAIVEVKLLDVSLADAPAKTIAKASVKSRRQVPIQYRLRFDDAQIKSGRSYALQAQITVDGQLWFTSTMRHTVFAGGVDNMDIPVQRVSKNPASSAPIRPDGRWLAEDIRQGGVIDRLQTVLEIATDGTITGTGGCNRMSGRATISGDKITFGPIASTKMACTPAAMNQEAKFFAALRDVRTWRIDPTRQKLALLDSDRKPVIVLAQM